ncbi:MAG: hypothetical protein EHM25_13055 [Nitrosopumilales archaeon]|nr:MAG: hypothetical protein EHM25_13055 [Nitrosopumilales archaeon]
MSSLNLKDLESRSSSSSSSSPRPSSSSPSPPRPSPSSSPRPSSSSPSPPRPSPSSPSSSPFPYTPYRIPLGDSVKENGLVMETKDTRMIVTRTENENLITGLIYKTKLFKFDCGNVVISRK